MKFFDSKGNLISESDEDKYSDFYHEEEPPEEWVTRKNYDKFHHTNIKVLDTPMTQGEIIAEIAATQEMTKQDVTRILNNYFDIMRREIIARGVFRVPGVLKVFSSIWNLSRQKIEKVPGVFDENGIPLFINPPSTVRPKVRLHHEIKNKYKMARRIEEAMRFRIPPEDWYKPFLIETPDYMIENYKQHQKFKERREKNRELEE